MELRGFSVRQRWLRQPTTICADPALKQSYSPCWSKICPPSGNIRDKADLSLNHGHKFLRYHALRFDFGLAAAECQSRHSEADNLLRLAVELDKGVIITDPRVKKSVQFVSEILRLDTNFLLPHG